MWGRFCQRLLVLRRLGKPSKTSRWSQPSGWQFSAPSLLRAGAENGARGFGQNAGSDRLVIVWPKPPILRRISVITVAIIVVVGVVHILHPIIVVVTTVGRHHSIARPIRRSVVVCTASIRARADVGPNIGPITPSISLDIRISKDGCRNRRDHGKDHQFLHLHYLFSRVEENSIIHNRSHRHLYRDRRCPHQPLSPVRLRTRGRFHYRPRSRRRWRLEHRHRRSSDRTPSSVRTTDWRQLLQLKMRRAKHTYSQHDLRSESNPLYTEATGWLTFVRT